MKYFKGKHPYRAVSLGLLILIAAMLFGQHASADETEEKTIHLRVGKEVRLDGIGMHLKPFENFNLVPQKPTTVKYTYQIDPKSRKRIVSEVYDLQALWKNSQLFASFVTPYGRFSIFGLGYVPPKTESLDLLFNRFIRLSDFYKQQKRQREWSKEAVDQWVEYAVNINIKRSAQARIGDHRVICFQFINQSDVFHQLYLLQNKKSKQLYALLFEPSPEYRFENFHPALKDLIASIRFVPIPKKERMFDNKHLDGKKRRSIKRDEELDESLLRAVRKIINLKDWWYTETKHYVILSNRPQKESIFIQGLERDVEVLKKYFSHLFPPIKDIDELHVIRVFATRQQYLAYVGEELSGSAGVWIPSAEEVVISAPSNEGLPQQKIEERLRQIFYHEIFHQYFFYALNKQSASVWFDEGHATLIEGIEFDYSNKSIQIKENPRRLKTLEKLIRSNSNEIDLKTFIQLDHKEFYKDPDKNYPVAWGLIYFLRKGTLLPAFQKRNYTKLLKIYLDSLITSNSRAKASKAFMDATDMDQLQRDFIRFWNNKELRNAAEKLPIRLDQTKNK